jgi:hypothetical protein
VFTTEVNTEDVQLSGYYIWRHKEIRAKLIKFFINLM